ncbi:MAG: FecR family protein [Pseudomonadota bacterium]
MKISSITTAVLAVCAGCAASAEPAGRVLALAGTATIERAGQQVALVPGALVESGDTFSVGERSTLQVRFTDESVVAIRANSQFKIEDYRFEKNAETDRSLLGLIRGGIRTITGLIGKANQNNYSVKTNTAAIGIRGTHFTVVYCNNDCSRPDGSREPNGTFGGVTDGRIIVSNQAGASEFGQQDYFYVPSANSVPIRLLIPPSILSDRTPGRGNNRGNGEGGSAIASGGSSSGSTSTTTSPKLIVQQSPMTGLTVPLTSVAAADQPGVLQSSGVGGGRITLLEARGNQSGPPVDINFKNLTTPEFAANESRLVGSIFYDAASAAIAVGQRIAPVSSSAAAGAYWLYEPPVAGDTNLIGAHHAFGDTPSITLPTAGIAQYSYAGGTAPTDNFGRVGSFSGSTLTMNFASQQVSNNTAMTFSFGTNALQVTPTVYNVPPGTSWSMGGGTQPMAGTSCTTGCLGITAGSVVGRFVGAAAQGYAASFSVGNSQLDTFQPNVTANVATFAKQ